MKITINQNKLRIRQNESQIEELKKQLADSDYKVLPDYDKTDDAIKAQRQAWREEIRRLEQENASLAP